MMLNRNFWLVTSISVILISGLSTGIAIVEINNNNNKKNNTKQNTDIQKINDIVSKSTDGAAAGGAAAGPATVDRGADAPPQSAPDDGVAGAGGAAGGTVEKLDGKICYYNDACMTNKLWDIKKCPTVKDACDKCVPDPAKLDALQGIKQFKDVPHSNTPPRINNIVSAGGEPEEVEQTGILYFTNDEYEKETPIETALNDATKRGLQLKDSTKSSNIPLSLFKTATRQTPYRCQTSTNDYFTIANGGILVASQ